MKYLPIALGVIILALLGVLIFAPANNEPIGGNPNATSTPGGASGQNPATSTPSESPGVPNATSTVYYPFTTTKNRVVRADVSANALIQSPLRITGNVPPGWAFEASFPIRILDANGKVLAQVPASVPNWMSPSGAWFGATLMFATPATATGVIVLENDNASGLPENADSVRIPVRFR